MLGPSYYDANGWASASIWSDNQGDTMRVKSHQSGKVHGVGDHFDFDAENMTEASQKLQGWGYRFIGHES